VAGHSLFKKKIPGNFSDNDDWQKEVLLSLDNFTSGFNVKLLVALHKR
jgi:hypothetical protein